MSAQYFSYVWCIWEVFHDFYYTVYSKYQQEQPAEYVNIDNHLKLVGDSDELLQDGRRLWRRGKTGKTLCNMDLTVQPTTIGRVPHVHFHG